MAAASPRPDLAGKYPWFADRAAPDPGASRHCNSARCSPGLWCLKTRVSERPGRPAAIGQEISRQNRASCPQVKTWLMLAAFRRERAASFIRRQCHCAASTRTDRHNEDRHRAPASLGTGASGAGGGGEGATPSKGEMQVEDVCGSPTQFRGASSSTAPRCRRRDRENTSVMRFDHAPGGREPPLPELLRGTWIADSP